MKIKSISILIPVLNEVATILKVIGSVKACNFGIKKEIIVIDNGSTDGTQELIKQLSEIKLLKQPFWGRAASLHLGIKNVSGNIIGFQDADLEIHPNNLTKMLKIMSEGEYQVVYGSRFAERHCPKNAGYFANKLLTFLANMVYGLSLSDVQTGCILINANLLKALSMKSKKWDFSIELASKLRKIKKLKITEVPVSYYPRSHKGGKKLSYFEGLRAIFHIFYYRFVS